MLKIITLLVALLLAACGTTQKAQFYLLEQVGDYTDVAHEPVATSTIIEVKLANIPGYLDRPQLVTRDQNHQVEINEFHRWAEPLQENIARVLTANLSAQLSSIQFLEHKLLLGRKPDYRLLVKILYLDSDAVTGRAFLQAQWLLQKVSDKNDISGQMEKINVPVANNSFRTRVQGQSQAIAILAERIAARIQ